MCRSRLSGSLKQPLIGVHVQRNDDAWLLTTGTGTATGTGTGAGTAHGTTCMQVPKGV